MLTSFSSLSTLTWPRCPTCVRSLGVAVKRKNQNTDFLYIYKQLSFFLYTAETDGEEQF